MRWLQLGLLTLALGLAGCTSLLGQQAGPAPGTSLSVEVHGEPGSGASRGSEEVWVAWWHGVESTADGARLGCMPEPGHAIDPTVPELRYTQPFSPSDVWGVLVVDHNASYIDGCPAHADVVPDPATRYPVELRGPLTVNVTVTPDGTLTVEGHEVLPGQAAAIAYTVREADLFQDGIDRYTGSATVEVLGAWPRDALERTR